MKEVRYNDRFWFGKHKGARIFEIINHDPNFIQKLINENKIKLDSKTTSYFERKIGKFNLEPIGIGRRPNFGTYQRIEEPIEPIEPIRIQIEPGTKISTQYTHNRNMEIIDNLRNIVNILFDRIHGEIIRLCDERNVDLSFIKTTFFNKLASYNNENDNYLLNNIFSFRLDFCMDCLEREVRLNDIILKITNNNNGRFDAFDYI